MGPWLSCAPLCNEGACRQDNGGECSNTTATATTAAVARRLLLLLQVFSGVVGAAAHGVLTTPLSRNSPLGAPVPGRYEGPDLPASNWFNCVLDGPNTTVIPANATNCDPSLLTNPPYSCFNSRGLPRHRCADAKIDRLCPWYAPGQAPITSPCGIELDRHGPRFPAHGEDGRTLPPLSTGRVQWRAGNPVGEQVAWTVSVNVSRPCCLHIVPFG
eukprot:COSAG05_NODE_478_length_9434_cov_5.178897_4_plen_215_part_00